SRRLVTGLPEVSFLRRLPAGTTTQRRPACPGLTNPILQLLDVTETTALRVFLVACRTLASRRWSHQNALTTRAAVVAAREVDQHVPDCLALVLVNGLRAWHGPSP